MNNFTQRLKVLIGEQPVSQFARKVGLGEATIRKYLNGSDPSLSKANQIAMRSNCSLEWLATGCGYQYRQAEVVDIEALKLALDKTRPNIESTSCLSAEHLKPVVLAYQFLRAHKKSDGFFDTVQLSHFLNNID